MVGEKIVLVSRNNCYNDGACLCLSCGTSFFITSTKIVMFCCCYKSAFYCISIFFQCVYYFTWKLTKLYISLRKEKHLSIFSTRMDVFAVFL